MTAPKQCRAMSSFDTDVMTHSTEWEAILPLELRLPALETIASIVSQALRLAPGITDPARLCDMALLSAYVSAAEDREQYRVSSVALLNQAIERVSLEKLHDLGLFGGLSGIGWSIEHISRLLSGEDGSSNEAGEPSEDPVADVDRAILMQLERPQWPGTHDLLTGLVGIGVYFLERLPRPSSRRGLDLVLNHLADLAEQSWGGTTWRTHSQFVRTEWRRAFPAGYYDVGVALGVPGVVLFLAIVSTAGMPTIATGVLLNGAVKWMLAQERPPDALSRFPSLFAPGLEPTDAGLSWWYGDLGVSVALYTAARVTGRRDWHRYAISLFERCLAWPVEKDGVADAGLCRGALGIAHVCNRFYHAERNPRHRDAANLWFHRGLDLWKTGSGLTESSSSLLDGGVGVALALISAAHPIAPEWDRLLLLSGRASST